MLQFILRGLERNTMGESRNIITEEDLVPAYSLPDVLTALNGERITRVEQWAKRRQEIVSLFEDQMYGRFPAARLDSSRVEIVSPERAVFGGRGTRREVRLWFEKGGKACHLDVLIYLPHLPARPVPVFIGLNFNGNHAVQPDPDLHISDAWFASREKMVTENQRSAPARGSEASRWPVARMIERGYGLATAYYGNLDPDFDDGFQNGLHPLFYRPGQTKPDENEWGAIGAWAWGLSRMLDLLEMDDRVDAKRVAVVGHSRLGKAALWAGASDLRFGLVISNNSGCGGAALSRRRFGETVRAINERFPHWFCKNFHRYNGKEDQLPFDQHMLISLIAPRPVYIASAQEDLWADPHGEFLSAYHASPVYRLLGSDGLSADAMPEVEKPIFSRIGYHIRRGPHDVTVFDWDCFMDFADLHVLPGNPGEVHY
jgi:hypothetical protein